MRTIKTAVKTAIALLAMLSTVAFAQQKGTFKDTRDGKTYKTVKIGTQTWMAENLNYSGTASNPEGACYDGKPANCTKYGRMYTWNFLICPKGWYAPTKEDWQKLIDFAGGKEEAGKNLKAKSGWDKHEGNPGNGEDKFGFAALPGGGHVGCPQCSFSDIGKVAGFHGDAGSGIFLSNSNGTAELGGVAGYGNVRCIQGEPATGKEAEHFAAIAKSEAEKKAAKDKLEAIRKANGSTFTDSRDKKTYWSIKIGDLVWMAQNLDYADKDSKCYDNKPENCKTYGRLYNFEIAKKACPSGWHLPNDDEWDALAKATGEKKDVAMLKTTEGWSEQYKNGTDDFGFSALPNGRETSSKFSEAGDMSYWWSNTNKGLQIYRNELKKLSTNEMQVIRPSIAVRCVQGEFSKAEMEMRAKSEAYVKANGGTFTDTRDKRTYQTIKIGNQTWMAENLDYADKDGKCHGNKPENCKTYGRLYNWETAMKVCPSGWHLPSKDEFQALNNAAGANKDSVALALKSNSGWNGTNIFGFSVLPGGKIQTDGSSFGVGTSGSLWSATSMTGVNAGYANCYDFGSVSAVIDAGRKTSMYNVRCVQGQASAQPAEQPKPAPQPVQQPPAKENCSITFPKKSCVSVAKGSCKMVGGKVVDKCP
jgi:uncharacterized protein (TIGR02145 family)